MSDPANVTLERCDRPSDEKVGALEVPHRPFGEGSWRSAHYFYLPGGTPSFRSMTHGDHDDLWYRFPGGDVLEPAV